MSPQYLSFYAYLNLIWLILVFSFGAHKVDRNTRKKSILFVYIRIIVFFFFFFLMYFQLTPLSYYPRDYIGFLFVIFFTLLVTWKFILYYGFLLYRKWGFNFRKVIILGCNEKTAELAGFFVNNKWHGYRFLGFFDSQEQHGTPLLGHWNDLDVYIRNHHVDEIYIAWDRVPGEMISRISELIADYPVKVRIVPDLGNFTYKTVELIQYGALPVMKIHPGPLSYWYNRLIKRVFDVFVSVLVIVGVLSWMVPLFYVIQLFDTADGVFFRQVRTRIDGRVFTCLKFRTMRKNPEADLQQAVENDNRITRLGRFMRMFSIDELPQFLNVLVGQMSITGPRPHMIKHTEEYRRLTRRFMLRHTVKPGITGLAQVNGFRGEIRCQDDLENRVKFDIRYVENWSFNLDLKIMLLTVWLIIRGQLKGS